MEFDSIEADMNTFGIFIGYTIANFRVVPNRVKQSHISVKKETFS